MFKTTAVMENTPSLNGLVRCANCATTMINNGTHYHCPNTTVSSGPNCYTLPVDAEYLLRRVTAQLVRRLDTEETLQKVADNAKDTTALDSFLQRQRMEEAEATISALNKRKAEVLQQVKQGIKTLGEVDEEINEINKSTIGLAYESLAARDELDMLEFISDEAGIRETVLDYETYLATSSAEDFQELLELVIKEIQVDTMSALIIYNEVIAAMDHLEGVSQDLIRLD